MKAIYYLAALPLFLTSCAGGWHEEDKAKLRTDCMSQSTHQIGEARATAYCDCFIEQVVKTYPLFNDFMDHMSLDTVEKLKAHCREQL